MSLTDIFSNAVSGLSASQAGLATVSNNIANVNVPGYARTKVSISTAASQGQVQGVIIGQPERVADSFLENAVYQRGGDMGKSEVVSSYLDRLQSLLGAPGTDGSLAERLNAIASAAGAMTGVQGSPQTVGAFTGNIQDALDTMGQLKTDVSTLRGDVETEVGQTINRVNVLLKQINDLNNEVASAPGHVAPGAENRRAGALEELSSLMKVTVRNQTDGRVTIETANGQTLLDKRLRQLSYPATTQAGAQSVYPPIDIRFADDKGNPTASTGETIDSSAVGGKLGGLLDLRDRALPQFSEQLGQLFSGIANSLNKVSNEGTTLPPPPDLTGRANGLVGTDRLGFTGKATFAVLGQDGTLVATTTVDFDALGPTATIDDAVTAINAGLGGAGTATMGPDGVFSIKANTPGNGVAVAQDTTTPSDRAGMGFSQFFGLNDVVRSDTSALIPSGLQASDPNGFAAGQTVNLALRDASGKMIANYTLDPAASGTTVGDMVNSLNGSNLGGYGVFSLDPQGRILFSPNSNSTGATISIPSDSTNRAGTGVNFSSMFGLTGDASGLGSAAVRTDILNDPGRLPLARLQLGAAVGDKAVGPGDMRGANDFVDQLQASADFGKNGKTTIDAFSAQLLGKAGADAATAQTNYTDASNRRTDAQTRRDNFAGVNIDEELSQMVILQNSYSAAARVVTTASQMYQTLVEMV